jgi:sugar lactone lactonase YvrE
VAFELEAGVVLAAGAALGEGPVWDPRDQTLLWTDIARGEVHRLSPDTGTDTATAYGQPVGAVAWRRGGGLVLATRDGFRIVSDSGAEQVVPVQADQPDQQMNDGKCDRRGRFWAGTSSVSRRPGASALYRLGPDRRVETVLTGVSMSNGLGWSPDDRLFYYVDSATQRVDAFQVDPDSGELRGRRPLVHVPRSLGIPDGLTVDADGCVWLALWGAGAVHRYTPAGRLDGVLRVPASQVTSCAFGGPGLRDLYVTSASQGLHGRELADQPLAGAVFAARPAVGGFAADGFAG